MSVRNLKQVQVPSPNDEMTPQQVAPHVLRSLARRTLQDERPATLETLVQELGVRRADVRRTLSALDAEGYLDVLRMKLTMQGFAVGARLLEAELPPLRKAKLSLVAA